MRLNFKWLGYFLATCLVLSFSGMAYAQNVISGKVLNENGQPLSGASVV